MQKVLIVDDEENVRKLYKVELEDEGYKVITAGNGEEAMQTLDEEKIDLVTLDIKMPGTDGIELLGKIRHFDRNIPIVVCSAYPSYKQDFHVWGAEAYIVKSADLSELKSTLKQLLTA